MFVFLMLGLLLVALFGLFWGGSLFAQSYLYNVPAEKMPLRALIGAAVMSLFFTSWVWLDQRSPGTYETILEFSPEQTFKVDEFQAVRLDRTGNERLVTYRKKIGGQKAADYRDDRDEPFSRSAADSMVVAIVITEGGKESRFETPTKTVKRGDREEVRFDKEPDKPVVYSEVDGDRYINDETAGTVIDPRPGVLVANLALNLVHFLLWWGVLWLALRYQWVHALGFGFLFGIAFVLLIMPVILEQN